MKYYTNYFDTIYFIDKTFDNLSFIPPPKHFIKRKIVRLIYFEEHYKVEKSYKVLVR